MLDAHDDVAVAVIPVSCPVSGGRIRAVPVPRVEAPPGVRAHCAGRPSDWRVPEAFAPRAEPPPRGAGGEVARTALGTQEREETT